MKLQGRNLQPNLRGQDVATLHHELQQVGYPITDAPDYFGETTFQAVKNFQQSNALPPTGIVDSQTAAALTAAAEITNTTGLNGYVVRGTLHNPDGSPVYRGNVTLFEKRLRSDVSLGTTTTDRSGNFTINYPTPTKFPFTIVVRVLNSQNKEIAASQPIYKVRPAENVALVVGKEALRGPSEFEVLEELLRPILTAEQLSAADLNEKEVDFLAGKYDLDTDQVEAFVAGEQHAQETGIRADAFYALIRHGFPAELPGLIAQLPGHLESGLKSGITENIVAESLETDVPSILTDLSRYIVQRALAAPAPDKPTFRAVFDLAGFSSRSREDVLERYMKRTGSVDDFWQDLRNDPDLDNNELDQLESTLQLSAIALNHMDLVNQLVTMRNAQTIGPNLRDLSQVLPSEWVTILDTQVQGKEIGAPQFLGKTQAEAKEVYATFLSRMVESIFPTPVLARRITTFNDPEFADVLTFFNDNPNFEFSGVQVKEYLGNTPGALDNVGDIDQTRDQLLAMSRLYDISPSYNRGEAMYAAMKSGVQSATAIRRMGATQFVRLHQDAIGFEEAQKMYSAAARKADTTLMVLSQSVLFNPTNPAIVAPHLAGQGIPAFEDLFGSLDLCQCSHCSSVYSPAAYLVDVLHYLTNRPAINPGQNAFDVLTARRPDLGEIELNCANTNTELPYVDLVLEILETAVVHGGNLPITPEVEPGADDFFPHQTTEDAATLGANPEHLNEQAYNLVRDAVFPFGLPFDLWHAEAKIYLKHLGVQLHELRHEFDFSGAADIPVKLAGDFLGLSPREREIITGESADALHTLWGFDNVGELNLFVSQANAEAMLEKTELTFAEIRDLLALAFIDPGSNVSIQFAGADCELETATISNLDNGVMDRLHRFVRLWRKGEWSIPELGAILEALPTGGLNAAFLQQLASLQQVKAQLKVPLDLLLTWVSSRIPTTGIGKASARYTQVFLDRTVHTFGLPIFALNAAGNELADNSQNISDHLSVVHHALGVSAADLQLLMGANSSLDLANLSVLYRKASLAQTLGLPIADFLALQDLSGLDPFQVGDLAPLQEFVAVVERMRKSSFSIAELDYLLRHHATEGVGQPEESVTQALVQLRSDLYQVGLAHLVPEEGNARLALTEQQLRKLFPLEVADSLLAVLNLTSDLPHADQVSLISTHFAPYLAVGALLTGLWNPSNEPIGTAEERVALVLPALQTHLEAAAREALVEAHLSQAIGLAPEVMAALLREYVTVPGSSDAALKTFLDAAFSVAVSPAPAPDFEATTDRAQFPSQYATFERLFKVGLGLERLEVPAEHLAMLLGQSGWLDWNGLPATPVAQAGNAFTTLLDMDELFQLGATEFGKRSALLDQLSLLEGASLLRADFLESLATATGWVVADLQFLVGSSALDLNYPNDFRDGRFLLALPAKWALLDQLKVEAETAHAWATQALTAGTGQALKQAARAQYADQAQWLTVAKPLRDELREQQRQALVAHLLQTVRIQLPAFVTPQPLLLLGRHNLSVQELQLKLNMAGARPPLKADGKFGPLTEAAVRAFQVAHGLNDDGEVGALTWAELNQVNRRLSGSNELYAHFLIDVEMKPCMLTSRIVLAHNSIQLFVQRCQLNLEPLVQLSPEDQKEWEWMKQYRVWEANRKVFLYPENWVLPELRDNKSPIFKELESGLLQDDITPEVIDREFLKYVNGLNEVAQLEIAGMYRNWRPELDTLHVFGRTRNSPNVYFYRQWIDEREWTPWERVNVDIETEHLVPVVWKERLFLFWPMFLEKAADAELDKDEEPNAPELYDEIRMVWTEYREGKWLPKQVSKGFITSKPTKSQAKRRRETYQFWPQIDAENRLYLIGNSPYNLSSLRQFRFSLTDGDLEVTNGGENEKFAGIDFNLMQGGFGNLRHYNGLVGNKSTKQHLNVVTEGKVSSYGRAIKLKDREKTKLLSKAASRYRLVVASDDRNFKSFNTFAYYDEKRTFFIHPRGVYSGGFGGSGGFGLSGGINPTHTGVDLPDQITKTVAQYVAHRNDTVLATGFLDPQNQPVSGDVVLAKANLLGAGVSSGTGGYKATGFRFVNHYHPYAGLLIEELNRYGIDGILKPDPEKEKKAQRKSLVGKLRRQQKRHRFFQQVYSPNSDVVDAPRPVEEFDFSYGGAYAGYNWELCYHAPLLMARHLSSNQKFAEAMRWFHYIFDPTYRPKDPLKEAWPERVWQIKPFYAHGVGESIQKTMLLLKSSGLTDEEKEDRKKLQQQVEAWRKDPFNPHLIARMRPEAYMKATVMAYLDNLLAWADSLYAQDSRESINEATQLYILAAELLGERPREISAHEGAVRTVQGQEVRTFNDLRGRLDSFSNALVELEVMVEPEPQGFQGGGVGHLLGSTQLSIGQVHVPNGDIAMDFDLADRVVSQPRDFPAPVDVPLAKPVPAILGPSLFFCIPKNDQLLAYWDKVEDRLFKIRHCLNIDGVARQLSLFQPAIDPGALVKAAAAGLDLGTVLGGLNGSVPRYRFQTLVQKTNELIGDVKSLGAALLSALEKKDAEDLAVLRATHEVRFAQKVRQLKVIAIDEARQNVAAIRKTRDNVEARRAHYAKLIENGLNKHEKQNMTRLEAAYALNSTGEGLKLLAGVLGMIPNFPIGVNGAFSTPVIEVNFGGEQLTRAADLGIGALQMSASMESYLANKASIQGGHDRRREEWDFQVAASEQEIEQINAQIAAAELRISMAEKDLENHDLQIKNAQEAQAFLKSKYTNAELYSWMQTEVSSLYFQGYQLAYDLAQQAEAAFRYELGLESSNYIQFGYWDSLKMGLLAGERLQADLRQLEVAYLEEHRREYELTKHVSLRQLNPMALLLLKANGACTIDLPEWLFDMDGPGHYMRRIKSISLSIPAVVGPYASVNCTLSLQKSSIRTSAFAGGSYPRDLINGDSRFKDNFGAIESIVTSSAQNDSGMFEVNFNDPRRLPFEGAGVISTWGLELPADIRQFDYNTISDVIVHVRYTARMGGGALAQGASDYLRDTVMSNLQTHGLSRIFSLQHDFPGAWHQFVSAAAASLRVNISRDHFPYATQASTFVLPSAAFEVWEVTPAGAVLVPNLTFNFAIADLNSADRVSELEIVGTLDPNTPKFLLMHYGLS